MDSKDHVLIGLGAAIAANCIPCFKHYYAKAQEEHVPDAEVLEAIEIGMQMKCGALMDMRKSIREIMDGKLPDDGFCCGSDTTPSCDC